MAIKFGRPIESRTRFTPVDPNHAAKDEQLDLSVRMRRNRRSEWARRMVREHFALSRVVDRLETIYAELRRCGR